MTINLWASVAIISVFAIIFVMFAIKTEHERKMKILEVEAIKAEKSNLKNEVDDAVQRRLTETLTRIEVLEAIVTDKNYELSDKITRLK